MAGNVNNVIEWQSHKEAAVTGLYKQLLEGNFLDAILFSSQNSERFIKCHKLVLSAMSPVFEGMIKITKDPGTALLVLDKDVDFQDLQNLIEYIYTGNTVVPHGRMQGFLSLGLRFQVAGFASSQPAEQQNSEELEEEITATISSNMMDSRFAVTPSRKPVIEPDSPAVQMQSPEVTMHSAPRMQAPAAVKKRRGRPSKAAKEESPSKAAKEARLFKTPRKSCPAKVPPAFRCEFCNNMYQQASLQLHRKSCKNNPDRQTYTCPVCNKTVQITSKYRHIKTHSKAAPSTSKRDTT